MDLEAFKRLNIAEVRQRASVEEPLAPDRRGAWETLYSKMVAAEATYVGDLGDAVAQQFFAATESHLSDVSDAFGFPSPSG